MLQNARQIRNVIKESPSEVSFESAANLECGKTKSEKETFTCLWWEVSKMFETTSFPDSADTLHVLTMVCKLNPPRSSFAKSDKFLKYTKEMMTNTASEYDVPRLCSGIAISVLATLAVLVACAEWIRKVNSAVLWTFSLGILYNFMMFASSYVEEEQHFWYWVASSWCGWLFLKK